MAPAQREQSNTILPGFWANPAGALIDLGAPPLLAGFVFAAGVLMLVSAATPSLLDRLSWLTEVVPLFVVEFSHFAASLIGLTLLFLAAGLFHRLRSAWRLTIGLLILSAGFAIFKGGVLEEAILFAALAIFALALGPSFYRRSRLSQIRLSAGYLTAVALCLVTIGWLGFFVYREVSYSNELWWTFVLYGDASRFLRASIGVAAFALLVIVRQAMARAPAPPGIGRTPDLARVAEILATAPVGDPQANLALLGDKRFLFAPDNQGFVQFAVRGRSWIAMGEPVSSRAAQLELIRQFQEAADRQGASSAIYGISRDHAADFIDAGYVVVKIGETALIELESFSLEGPRRAPLRHARNKAIREGLEFEILPPGGFTAAEPALRSVSDAWLASRQGQEKTFSLGRFNRAFLQHFPIALVRWNGEILAFANLWPTVAKERLSLDLMRYGPAAPNGTMDFLMCEIILWAKAQGYRRFDLGMAPLAGLEDRRSAPLASRLGALVFRHGGRLYGFAGLRSYKQKFEPRWECVYLAVRTPAEVSGTLASVALLTSGGFKGLLS